MLLICLEKLSVLSDIFFTAESTISICAEEVSLQETSAFDASSAVLSSEGAVSCEEAVDLSEAEAPPAVLASALSAGSWASLLAAA